MNQSSELMSIQKYAVKHHVSIYSVIKKTMKGELPTVVKEENGKEITYIVITPSAQSTQAEIARSDTDEEIEINYKKEYELLHLDYLILKTKYEKLLESQQS
jgi:hypothetical protein